jgi:hypothetical protein
MCNNMCIHFPYVLFCLYTCHAKVSVAATTVQRVDSVWRDESSKGMHQYALYSACTLWITGYHHALTRPATQKHALTVNMFLVIDSVNML